MSELKHKAITGVYWSFIGRVLQDGSKFFFGIILARLLLPAEYGLVAMANVVIVVAFVFVDSGFSVAIIQRKHLSNLDLSTIFFINLVASFFIYFILYISAGYLANFYNSPELKNVFRVISIIIILNALSLVQNSLIRRDVNFKLRTRIEFVSQLLSSSIAIALAFQGYGVWSLVWKTLFNQIFINIQLWLQKRWKPSIEFSFDSFKEIFSFSSYLLLSGIMGRIYDQIYRLVVGKFYPASELGLYSKSENLKDLPSEAISQTLLGFLLPVFSLLQNEPIRMKSAALKTIKIVLFCNISALTISFVISKPLILVLFGEKWSGTIPYFRLLLLIGLLKPLLDINIQILTSLGKTALHLKIEIIKKIFCIPAVFFGIFIGIKTMILGMFLASLISLFINAHYTKKLINLGLFEQLKSILKTIILAVILLLTLEMIKYLISDHLSEIMIIVILCTFSILIIISFSRFFKMEEYYEIKNTLNGFLLRKRYHSSV